MTELINSKNLGVEAHGLVDVALLGVAKSATEIALKPVIGNGTVVSGLLKLGGGAAVHELVGGRIGKALGGGMVVDGIEDLTISLLSGVLGNLGGVLGGSQAAQGEVW